ncbi:MAG: tripartite tricarboxylate transporter substrate binding protein [Xanthobacteraceae bacterium]|jgi:tripartite-type tricarboxylate transporter receptor subunit TctC
MKTLKTAAALALLCLTPALAQAQQAWQPTRQIKAIVPFPAGGGTDLMGRLVAKGLSERLGQQVYVENIGGANGSIGVQAVQRAEPDGYTIGVLSDGPMIVNPALYPNNPYQTLRDFVPVAMVNRFPSLLTAHPSTGIKTVADLIRIAKEKPGTLNYSSGGIGNFSHMGLELLAHQTRIKIVHVPYKGVGPATLAVLSGEVQLMYNNVATAIEHVRAGKNNGLAIGESKRMAGLPDVPTIAETVPGYDFSAWIGIYVPAKTPAPVVARISKAIAEFLQDPATQKYFSDQFITASYKDSPEFSAYIKDELTKWDDVVKKAGIKVQQ